MLIGPNWCPWGVPWRGAAALCASSCKMDSEFSQKVVHLLSCKSLLFTKYGGSGSCTFSLPPTTLFLCSLSLAVSLSLFSVARSLRLYLFCCCCFYFFHPMLGDGRKRKSLVFFFFDSINSHKKVQSALDLRS